MKILYVASEASPFIKTGGLADVAGSLPQAIKGENIDIRVVIPLYSAIEEKYKREMEKEGEFYIELAGKKQYVGFHSLLYEGILYYFIDNEYYFKRDKIYGEYDDGERFIYFSKAVTVLIKEINFSKSIIHLNDWHTALIALYIKDFAKGDNFYKNIKSVFTIHNLKYQGIFDKGILGSIAGISMEYFKEEGLEYFTSLNLMKAGIVYSDALTTVSKTYAEEIRDSYYGEGLEAIIKEHESKLVGIINGIDYDLYNPEKDKNLHKNYNYETIEKKKENKKEIQKFYNLPDKDLPLLAMVSRLVAMKGLDLVKHILEELLQEDIQLIILGTGDKEYEDLFNHFQYKYPDKLASRIYFSNKEAHMIYGAADIFLMPSMAEPCGISQLISLRYGTIPIVRETGGLKDTVISYNKYTGEGNGFTFKNFNAHELLFTIKDALKVYKDKGKWNLLIKAAMDSKNDWGKSSQEYIEIYKKLLS